MAPFREPLHVVCAGTNVALIFCLDHKSALTGRSHICAAQNEDLILVQEEVDTKFHMLITNKCAHSVQIGDRNSIRDVATSLNSGSQVHPLPLTRNPSSGRESQLHLFFVGVPETFNRFWFS